MFIKPIVKQVYKDGFTLIALSCGHTLVQYGINEEKMKPCPWCELKLQKRIEVI